MHSFVFGPFVAALLAVATAGQRSVPDAPRTTDSAVLEQHLQAAKVTLAEAITKALAAVPGHALHASFQRARTDGRLVPRYEIEVLAAGGFVEVHVDPESGAVTASERRSGAAAARTGEMVFEFEQDELPVGFAAKETNAAGTPAAWRIETAAGAPDGARAVVVDSPNKRSTFNLLERRGRVGPDLELSVRIQAWKGEEDRGGGLFWRAKDADNYYVARWNPLEHNVRVYTVVAGKRSLPMKSAEVEADPNGWHELAVTANGARITIRFDGKIVLEAEDATFAEAGNVGLWTKADASTRFDSLRIQPRRQ